MHTHVFILAVALSLGMTTAQAAQLPHQVTSQKETSIIKNVAASLKTTNQPVTATKHSALEQLLQDTEQRQTVTISAEESRALARLNTNSANPLFQKKKFSSIILQRLFGG